MDRNKLSTSSSVRDGFHLQARVSGLDSYALQHVACFLSPIDPWKAGLHQLLEILRSETACA